MTAAWAAVRVKNSYLHAQFLRIKARRGAKKAILAVAASMLTAAYYMLRDGVEYRDLGPDHFDRQRPLRKPSVASSSASQTSDATRLPCSLTSSRSPARRTGAPNAVSRKSKSQPSLACRMWRLNIQP